MKIKKSIIIFFIISISIFSQDWEKIMNENKKIDSFIIESKTENKVVLKDVVIEKIKINRIYTNLKDKKSEVIILKKDLEQSFLNKNKDIKEINLTLGKDKMIAKGSTKLLGMVMDVYLEGIFEINDKMQLEYDIKKAKVSKVIPVPQAIIKSFVQRLNPIFKFSKFGIPLYVTEIIFEKDRIIFR